MSIAWAQHETAWCKFQPECSEVLCLVLKTPSKALGAVVAVADAASDFASDETQSWVSGQGFSLTRHEGVRVSPFHDGVQYS